MYNIGNDIIDLNLAKTESNWQRKGFLEKQFTNKEKETILKAENPFLQVWVFWSMKEAAYKCYTQKFEKRFFAPKKFKCNVTYKNEGIVVFEDLKFYTTTLFNSFYVHTIARTSQEKGTFFSNIGSSKMLATDIELKLSEETGVPSENIKKRKTSVGVPAYYNKEKLLTNSCSISHHGNFGAFVFTLEYES
jgi:phosphopantetheinyl transferase (holo-ACP synthase)